MLTVGQIERIVQASPRHFTKRANTIAAATLLKNLNVRLDALRSDLVTQDEQVDRVEKEIGTLTGKVAKIVTTLAAATKAPKYGETGFTESVNLMKSIVGAGGRRQ